MTHPAADAILRITNMLKPLLKAAELLDEYQSFQTAIDERKVQAEKLAEEILEVQREVAATKKKAAASVARGEEAILAANTEAKGIIDAAVSEAAITQEKAISAAEAIVDRARQTVSDETRATEHRASMARVECEKREAEISRLDEIITGLQATIQERTEKLAKIDERIKQLLGG